MKRQDIRSERKRRRREENKKFILKAAERVFARKGYGTTTVDDIAEEAQFSKATLYKYFRSKGEIFLEVILNSFEEAHQKIEKIFLQSIRAEEKLMKLIHYIASYYHKKKNISRILFMEKAAIGRILSVDPKEQLSPSYRHPKIPAEFKAKMEDIHNIICEVIREGVRSGEFRNLNVEDAAFIFGALLRGFHFRGPIYDREYKVNETTKLIHSFFLYGIKKDRKT